MWSWPCAIDDDGDDDDDEDDDEESDDDGGALDLRRVEELRIKRAIKQYDDDYIGELDPDDPEVRGTGFNEAFLDSAMDEFLQEKRRTDAAAAAAAAAADGDDPDDSEVCFQYNSHKPLQHACSFLVLCMAFAAPHLNISHVSTNNHLFLTQHCSLSFTESLACTSWFCVVVVLCFIIGATDGGGSTCAHGARHSIRFR